MEVFNAHTEDFQKGVVIPVNKPLDWTSFDVVKKIRYTLKYHRGIEKIKIGHAGTLDPKATGLLLVCTGKATKHISEFQDMEKTYIANIKLGATTPSFDTETNENEQYPVDHITKSALDDVLGNFTGTINQIPPEYSALKYKGKRAYTLAREGKHPKLKSREIYIENIKLTEFRKPFFSIYVTCRKGTYLRSLARDIGKELNSGAYLVGLIRTQIGSYKLSDAYDQKIIENILIK
ncbi:MAG: tRNA pseudouridine(55) synthase TruB [Candidatus Delongbacteria bacterium]|jgi:tRNA pseudouridine55 synthase|nr:tRNA pseudouridine(55) synthase TruB [Candidatus Delongbacteria bacterium]